MNDQTGLRACFFVTFRLAAKSTVERRMRRRRVMTHDSGSPPARHTRDARNTPPLLLHSCACHRNPAAPRLRRKRLSSTRSPHRADARWQSPCDRRRCRIIAAPLFAPWRLKVSATRPKIAPDGDPPSPRGGDAPGGGVIFCAETASLLPLQRGKQRTNQAAMPWMAETCQSPPRLRRKVHSSTASVGWSGSPSTTRPVARSRVTSMLS